MASALSTMLTSYRTAIAAGTSLSNLPANLEIEDSPASLWHQRFVLVLASPTRSRESHGGGTYEYEANVALIATYAKNVDEEALHNTIADDLIDADVVMLAAANRSSGTLLVNKLNSGTLEEDEDLIAVSMEYRVICRETKDLT